MQFQQQMFDDMFAQGAAVQAKTEEELYTILYNLLTDAQHLSALQEHSATFAREKSQVIQIVLQYLSPYMKALEKRDAA